MTQNHISQFKALGYAVVPGVFKPDEIARMADAFDRIHDRALAGGRNWRDRNTFFCLADDSTKGKILRYVQWPGWIDPTLEEVRRDPRMLEILAPLIGPGRFRRIRVSSGFPFAPASRGLPGSRQLLHPDRDRH